MCIRDSNNIADVAATGKKIIDEVERAVVGKRKLLEMIMASMSVSYTHLTLPTSDLV